MHAEATLVSWGDSFKALAFNWRKQVKKIVKDRHLKEK